MLVTMEALARAVKIHRRQSLKFEDQLDRVQPAGKKPRLAKILGAHSAAAAARKTKLALRRRTSKNYNDDFVEGGTFMAITSRAFSPRTLASRRSQLRQIMNILRETYRWSSSMKAKAGLVLGFTPDNVQLVTDALLGRQIASGGAYLQAWKTTSLVDRPTCAR